MAADLATGVPLDHGLRSAVLANEIGEAMGLWQPVGRL